MTLRAGQSPAFLPATAPRRIVVRGVNWLGDAVMTTPALLRLREAFPHSRVSLLTPAKLAELYLHHPAVDDIMAVTSGEGLFGVAKRVRGAQFDLGIVFPNSPRSALELWLGRVAVRVGYRRPWRNGFLTHAIPSRPGEVRMRKRPVSEIRRLVNRPSAPGPVTVGPGAHHACQYLNLVGALGANPEPVGPKLGLSAAERQGARLTVARIAANEATARDGVWLGLNAGAEYGPAKRWPLENFIAVANAIRRHCGANWLILGGSGDQERAQVLQQAIPSAANLAGRTSLRELMITLSCCDALVTNDTGPMHLAAALGVPVVALFGSTSPELTGPGLPGDPRHRVLRGHAPCSPCFLRDCPIDLRCLNSIAVQQVVDAVTELLGKRDGRK